jgi:hypothetical protein
MGFRLNAIRIATTPRRQQVVWCDHLLTPLVTLRLFLIQLAHGNCAIAALLQLGGIAIAPREISLTRRYKRWEATLLRPGGCVRSMASNYCHGARFCACSSQRRHRA